jgi:hypothetical protein
VVLLVVNVVFAALAGFVAWRWWQARRAVVPVAADGVDLRVKARPPDEDQVEAWVERALAEVDPRPAARTSGPVVADAATLVELATDDADAVVAALVGVLLADGYEVRRTKGRQVQLRRGPDRVVLEVAASD